MTACIGGWCTRREQCPHHTAGTGEPSERLCIRGKDGKRLIRCYANRVITLDVFTGQETGDSVETAND